MKLFKLIVMAGAFVLLAHGSAYAAAGPGAAAPFSDLKAIGAGIVTLGAALGIGMLAKGAFESMARQPEIEAKARQYFFLTVGLVEAMYFINLLFMVVFVYVFAAKSVA